MSRRPGDVRNSQRNNNQGRGPLPSGFGLPRWVLWAILGLILVVFLAPTFFSGRSANEIPYTQFRQEVTEKKVKEVTISQDGRIVGTRADGSKFTSAAP